ncbi:TPA: hypothetical protein V1H70_001456 [Streptococcus pneumoniae]|nr:hypothetical protein [Streptococcus pneumoniae]
MKIFTYQDFLDDKEIITFELAEIIYNDLISSSNIHDPEFKKYWKEFIELCVKYAEIRGNWLTLSREEKLSSDEARTIIHNKVIYQLKLLKGLANAQGKDVSWFERFNDDRKRIGDFACYVAYIYALNAR